MRGALKSKHATPVRSDSLRLNRSCCTEHQETQTKDSIGPPGPFSLPEVCQQSECFPRGGMSIDPEELRDQIIADRERCKGLTRRDGH